MDKDTDALQPLQDLWLLITLLCKMTREPLVNLDNAFLECTLCLPKDLPARGRLIKSMVKKFLPTCLQLVHLRW